MRRKMFVRVGLALAALGGLLTAFVLLVRHEPGFYRSKEIQAGPLRTQQGKQFLVQFTNLINNTVLNNTEGGDSWQSTFTEAQINSYFQEEFLNSKLDGAMPVKGVSSPRVAIDNDIIRVGFRYGEPPWSTIVSIDFKIWPAPNEPNVVAVQLLGVRAGLIPLSSKFLMDQLTALVQNQNKDIEVSWYRHEGYLVALLRFGASRPRQANQLRQLKVTEGKIIVAGEPVDPVPHTEIKAGKGE